MKRGWTLLVSMAIVCAAASTAPAQGPKAAKPEGPPANGPTAKQAPQATAAEVAELRAKIHRTMAALIEAQSAQQPDQEKITQLTGELQGLRAQLWASGATGPAGAARRGWAAGAWQCPWGGPGPGRGAAWGGGRGGPGRGYGRGQGWGRGPGYGPGGGYGPGPGYGAGWGRGQGLGPAATPGGGRGPGAGRGAGFGPGAGQGRGAGRSPGFVDKNNNGICDNFEAVRGVQK